MSKRIVKMHTFDTCWDCDYSWDKIGKWWCGHEDFYDDNDPENFGRRINIEATTIPSWCPLEDADE